MSRSSKEFEQIFEEYFSNVYGYLISFCQNEHIAEELTQETFFQVLKSLPNFRGECSLLTWLCQIAKNVWYQYLRKGNKHSKATVEIDDELIFQGLSTEESYILRESKISLYQNIRLLDEQMKEVVLMRISGYLSFEEIGEIFGKSASWARVTYHRARLILQEEAK